MNDPIVQLLTFLLSSVVSGGVVAYMLDDIPAWTSWKPVAPWMKSGTVLALTAVVVFLLNLALQVAPSAVGQLPVQVQVAIGAAAAFLVGQILHQYDLKMS